MSKRLLNDLQKLVTSGVISQENADAIEDYYQTNRKNEPNLMMIIFGVLGALLIGLGIILILAHNWDAFTRWQKTIIAFLPMVIGQVICGFTLWKKNESITWREASATFLVFAIGACISLTSQIYHIEGSMAGFMLMWTLLTLPVIYVMRSSMASLLYLMGITFYGCEAGYFNPDNHSPHIYWVLLLLGLPYYYHLIKKQPAGNATLFHHVFVPLSVIICLGVFAKDAGLLVMPAYLFLFGILYLISQSSLFEGKKWMQNPYLVLGSLGTLFLFFLLSFDGYWKELFEKKAELLSPFFSIEMIISMLLLAVYGFFLYQKREVFNPLKYAAIGSLIAFFLAWASPVPPIVIINIMILVIGIYFIRAGSAEQHLGLMNFGLLTIAILIACRFFDIELSFVMRGILFVLLGIGFFVANYFLMKKTQKAEES